MTTRRAVAEPAWRTSGRLLGVALRRACPRCGRAPIWRSWFRLRERCDACGFVPHRGEPDYFIGAYLVNLIVAELACAVLVAAYAIATWPPDWDVVRWLAVAIAVAAPLVAYPFTVTLWLAVDVVFRPESE